MSVQTDPLALVRHLPDQPGVYRMLDSAGQVIYVGKARRLRRRVSSYFNRSHKDRKTEAMVAQIADVEFTLTHTEAEALILENTLIKRHNPRYNILLRDDKSYPYILLSDRHRFPRLGFYRGARRREGRSFGPFPSAGAVRNTLGHLQKIFPVRQCQDSFFAHRSRPCLQYQIKRCTAPCVGLVSEEAYARDVDHAIRFLEGRSSEVIDELVREMEAAAGRLDFEQAAVLRNRIASLRRVQERQHMEGDHGDLDVVACAIEGRIVCVQVFVFRNGQLLGNRAHFPRIPGDVDEAEVLAAFLARHYLGNETPREILLGGPVAEPELIAQALAEAAGHAVQLRVVVRGDRRHWVELAVNNARAALQTRLASQGGHEQRVLDLEQALGLEDPLRRIECFDISHTLGEATVASCVVFNRDGPLKSAYRRFNIEGVTAGDDYAAMHQALTRRYTRVRRGEGELPDVLVIDGGPGQLAQALQVLDELQVEGVTVLGLAKGPERKAGLERVILGATGELLDLPRGTPGRLLLQQVRDEAHRFAITGHRAQRARARNTSSLEQIPGLGPKRRQLLLKQFGGLRGIASAGVEDLTRIKGVSDELARRIYEAFHGCE
jgi:excinuclease ABC subunit C